MLNMPQPSCSTTQAVPSESTKVTYREEDFPSIEEAKAYRLSVEDFEEYKQLFLGQCVPTQPFSNQELASKGYRSWPYYDLLQGLANT
jgi:hypothetical protein